MAQHDDSSSEDEEPPEKYIPRPARLGVGANPNQAVHGGSTHGLSEANRRLGNALKRQAYAAENKDDHNIESSDDEEVESRARAVGKRLRRDRKIESKQAIEKGSLQSRLRGQTQESEQTAVTERKEKGDSDSDGEWGDDVLRRMTEEQDAEFQCWSKGFVSVEDADANSHGKRYEFNNGEKRQDTQAMFKHKKKKKRSRQKNLRRDKRKQHELPAHLTEETLKAGRVRKSDSGKAEFHASRGDFSSRKDEDIKSVRLINHRKAGMIMMTVVAHGDVEGD
ncbi:hypothetical protein FGB62_228g022 [Gracilaria domingensis]|nr:hypothetical protein FGB62_228g022 [Gracilaria domingensis]